MFVLIKSSLVCITHALNSIFEIFNVDESKKVSNLTGFNKDKNFTTKREHVKLSTNLLKYFFLKKKKSMISNNLMIDITKKS